MANNYLQFSCALNDLTDKEIEWCRATLSKLSDWEANGESKADFEWSIEEQEQGELGIKKRKVYGWELKNMEISDMLLALCNPF